MSENEPVVLSGRYELHRRIARGGMAEVFLARDQLLDRPVAVKILFPEFAADDAFVERFRREAQSSANLNHANIVGVYDWGTHAGTYFIVMEYVKGRSLAEILRAEGTLHPDRAADIAIDMAGALYFAHRNGVVHRDIKPGNVLVSPTGQLKVTDFGIARAIGGTTSDNLTETGSVMGTATYFSPEQAQGDPVDPRSDLYSLGVVLYEMVAGTPPFSGDTPVAIAYKHVQESPRSPRGINPAVPAALEAIILKLLAKNPANRYASAEELRNDLRRFRQNQPINAEGVLPPSDATPPIESRAPRAYQPPPVGVNDRTAALPQAVDRTAVAPVYQTPVRYESPRRTGVFLTLLVLLLLGIGGLIYRLLPGLIDPNPDEVDGVAIEVVVPDLVNSTIEQARVSLAENDLIPVESFEQNDDVTPGVVFRQDPPRGRKVESGTEVELRVSAEEVLRKIPTVTGLSEDRAKALLRDFGFEVDPQRQTSDTVAQDFVISQDPPGNTDLAEGEFVTIVVSLGAEEVPVPDVKGLSQVDAVTQLGRAGFQVTEEKEPSNEFAIGTVVRTDPPANAQLAPDSLVTIFVADGVPFGVVPDVRDLTEGTAVVQLQAANFNVVIDTIALPTGDGRIGRVTAQAPPPNAELEEFNSVRIVVGRDASINTTTTPPPTIAPNTTTTTAPTTTAAPNTTAAPPTPTTTATTSPPTTAAPTTTTTAPPTTTTTAAPTTTTTAAPTTTTTAAPTTTTAGP